MSPTPTAPAGPVRAVGYSVLLLGFVLSFVFLLLGWILLRKALAEGENGSASSHWNKKSILSSTREYV